MSLLNGDINGIDSVSGKVIWSIDTGNKLLESTSISPTVNIFHLFTN